MAGTNEFKLFAGPATNTLTPAAWAAQTSLLLNGFSSGLASSQQANTLFRQLSTVVAGIGQFVANQNVNALDNGDVNAFANALQSSMQVLFAPKALASTRAWVVFNGFTGAIASSYNVSSITKIATGTYEINFITPMTDTNYGFAGSAGEQNGVAVSGSNPGGNNIICGNGNPGTVAVRTVNKLRVYCWEGGASIATEDASAISVNVFGN